MKVVSEFSEYAEALRNREIRVKECESCEWESVTPRVYCPECHSASWSVRHEEPVGIVYTRTTIKTIGNTEIGEPPFDVGLVEFPGGARLFGQLAEGDNLSIDDEVQLLNTKDVEGTPIPVFTALE